MRVSDVVIGVRAEMSRHRVAPLTCALEVSNGSALLANDRGQERELVR